METRMRLYEYISLISTSKDMLSKSEYTYSFVNYQLSDNRRRQSFECLYNASKLLFRCDDDTQSDYVIFSNYQTHDRTNRRYCGTITPMGSAVVSESNYFRMIFKTNEIFDATGFFARYQFVRPRKCLYLSSTDQSLFIETAQIKRVKSPNSRASPSTHIIDNYSLIIAIISTTVYCSLLH